MIHRGFYFSESPQVYATAQNITSSLFYGQALGLQGKIKKMREAFKKGSKISGIPVNKDPFAQFEREILILQLRVKSF